MLFAVAAIGLKLTSKYCIDIWRTCFVSNITTAILFQPLWWLSTDWPVWHLWWQPAIVAGVYILGQVLTLVSLTRGEISVSAPVLGLKIIFVPIFLWTLSVSTLPATIWAACSLATLAVVLLNYTTESGNRKNIAFSATTAALGAASFALFDVCVQSWSPHWAGGGFLPAIFVFATLFTLALIPMFDARLREIPAAAWPPLWVGSIFIAIQALAIVVSVAFWQQAASTNVVYSTRGLWSLGLIALVGQRFGIPDKGLSRRVFAVRLSGALLLMVAIGMLVSDV